MNTLLFLNMGGGEIFLILLIVIIFFGSKKIPELARGLGKGMREFKDATNSIQNEIQRTANEVASDIKKDLPTREGDKFPEQKEPLK